MINPILPAIISSAAGGGAPVPVIKGSSSASDVNNVTTLTVPSVAGVASGDVLVLFMMIDNGFASDQFNAISGWTKLGESHIPGIHIGCFYKVASGGEGSVTSTWGSICQAVGFQIRISGVNNATPIDGSNLSSSAANSAHTIPEITTVFDNSLALYALGFDGGDGYPFSVASPWTQEGQRQANNFTTTVSGCWGSNEIATAGLTGDAVVTCNVSDQAAYLQLGLKAG